MGQMHQYLCMQCGYKFEQEVPLNEMPHTFGDKVVCGKCGSTEPKSYHGLAY